MSLKDIISKFNKKEEEELKVFLAVEISLETIKSALWTIKAGKTEIIKAGSLEEWDGKNKELLLAGVDKSISSACEKIESEPEGIIFGLPNEWIEDDKISEKKKELLKFICQKLELKPLGFVVTLEALVTYLKNLEGTPLNAIFIQVQESQNLVSLVQLGKVKQTKTVGHSDDLAADVREGLARFKKIENFPARMILFNGTLDLEEYKQQLVSFDWMEKLPFLHFPKVESLEANKTIEAVALAGGSEVAKSLGFIIKEKVKTEEPEEEKPMEKSEPVKEPEKEIKEEEVKEEPEKKEEKVEEKESEEKEKVELDADAGVATASAASLGFVQGADIAHVKPGIVAGEKEKDEHVEKKKDKVEEKKEFIRKEGQQTEKVELDIKTSDGGFLTKPFSFVSKGIGLIKRSVFNLRLLFLGSKKRFLAVALVLFLFIGAGGVFAFYWYVPKANITLYLTPKVLEKELELTLDTSISQINLEDRIIPGNQETITVEGEKKTATTGEKIIGDKATGEVVVYNKTDVGKTFAEGTVLVGPDNLKFILDEEVSVASKSSEPGDEGESIVYGKSTVKITAASIGTESNLGGSSTFSFKDYSDSLFSAKNNESLSGGTSREIKIVSQEDISSLLKELTEELEEEAVNKLKKDLSSEKGILDQGLESEILDEDFSAAKNDETDQLELKLKTEFTVFSYQKADLAEILKQTFKDDLEDFVFDPSKADIEIEDVEIDKDQIKLITKIKANLLPKVDFTEIKKSLVGQKIEKTKDYLQDLPNFAEADIEITPSLLGGLKTLPRSSKNIIIETEVD